MQGYDHEEVINICIGLFNNANEIIEAKACLAKVYGDKIKEIDSKLFTEICKDRRDGKLRPEIVAHVRDIISVFQALDGTQCIINIIAKDIDKVPLIKDIGMASEMSSSIEKRITEMEAKFQGFETRFVENEQLKREHEIMKDHITSLNNQMKDMNKNLTDAYANIVVLEAENKRLTDELKSVNLSGGTHPSLPSSHVDGTEENSDAFVSEEMDDET